MKLAVAVALYRSDGRILMQLRDDGRGKVIPYPNTWCFPGGSVEPNESLMECLIREMREEFEIKIHPDACHHLLIHKHDDTEDHMYACKITDGTRLVLHEGADMRWMTLEEIKRTPIAWGAAEILPTVEKFLDQRKNLA
jgi:8-oxo-dGTP diphosphatase